MRCLKMSLKKQLPTGNLVMTVRAFMSSWHRGSSERFSGSKLSEIKKIIDIRRNDGPISQLAACLQSA